LVVLKRFWGVFGGSEKVLNGFRRFSIGFRRFWEDFRRVLEASWRRPGGEEASAGGGILAL